MSSAWNVCNDHRRGLYCARTKRRKTWLDFTHMFPGSIRLMNPGLRKKRQPSAGSLLANPAAVNSPITFFSCSRPMGGMSKRLKNVCESSRDTQTITSPTCGEKRSAGDGTTPPAGRSQCASSRGTGVGIASLIALARESTAIFAGCAPVVGQAEVRAMKLMCSL